MMRPDAHQVDMAERGFAVLKEHAIVYLAAEERTGKTLSAIMIAERCTNIKKVLVLTTKAALEEGGWQNTLRNYRHDKVYMVTNYHQVSKVTFKPDLLILDEAHNYIAGFPKESLVHKHVAKKSADIPIIYISATPHAQTKAQLYHQLSLSTWSPWAKYKTFLKWFKDYGLLKTIYVQGRQHNVYTEVQVPKVDADTKHLFVTATRKSIGFKEEPSDKLHYVELTESTQELYNTLVKKRIADLAVSPTGKLVCDTTSRLRHALYMLEGGVYLYTTPVLNRKGNPVLHREYYVLDNNEKINYIKKTWGDVKGLVIYYYYKAEGLKLQKHFKHALILHSTSHAEGIDLHKYDTIVVYSQDWRTSKYSQRRARQANRAREKEIIVHYLVVAKGVSEQNYITVAKNKMNFVDSVFIEQEL